MGRKEGRTEGGSEDVFQGLQAQEPRATPVEKRREKTSMNVGPRGEEDLRRRVTWRTSRSTVLPKCQQENPEGRRAERRKTKKGSTQVGYLEVMEHSPRHPTEKEERVLAFRRQRPSAPLPLPPSSLSHRCLRVSAPFPGWPACCGCVQQLVNEH